MPEGSSLGIANWFPTISTCRSLHHALLAWHWCPGTADEEVKLGAPAGVGANLVMLVEVDLPRVHHLPVQGWGKKQAQLKSAWRQKAVFHVGLPQPWEG